MRPIRKFSTSATRPFQSSDDRVPASTIFSPSRHPKPTSSNTDVDAAAATDDDIISPSNKATSWLLSAIFYLYRKWDGEKERNQGKIPQQSLFFERECCPKNMHQTAWPKSVRVREHFHWVAAPHTFQIFFQGDMLIKMAHCKKKRLGQQTPLMNRRVWNLCLCIWNCHLLGSALIWKEFDEIRSSFIYLWCPFYISTTHVVAYVKSCEK